MALGVKKITESVIEEKRALTTIGNYMPSDDLLDINDNNAIEAGGLFSGVIVNGGVLRVKTGLDKQARIDADKSLSLESVSTRLLEPEAVTSAKIRNLAVTTNKIADKSVTAEKFADRCISSIKIQLLSEIPLILQKPQNREVSTTQSKAQRGIITK